MTTPGIGYDTFVPDPNLLHFDPQQLPPLNHIDYNVVENADIPNNDGLGADIIVRWDVPVVELLDANPDRLRIAWNEIFCT